MIYLVDANVLSEPTRPNPRQEVVQWLMRHEQEIAVNPIIIGEIRYGIHLLPMGTRRRHLERWFGDGIEQIHCIAFDAATGLRWARLLADLKSSRRAMPIKDSLIAATALTHDLTIATRNIRDFDKAGVKCFDPFLPAP